MNFNITFGKKALNQFNSLDKSVKLRIQKAVYDKLLVDPNSHLKSLLGRVLGYYKFRIGDYRLICSKKNDKIIVVEIGHRKEIYKIK